MIDHSLAAHKVVDHARSFVHLILLLLGHAFFGLVDFVDSDLEHLALALNVKDAVVFIVFGRRVVLCHHLGSDVRDAWLEAGASRLVCS